MRTTQSLSITLPLEMAQMVKAKVSSGEYATESEVIRDGLRTLAARDAAVEKWLIEDVVPTYDAHHGDPTRASCLSKKPARGSPLTWTAARDKSCLPDDHKVIFDIAAQADLADLYDYLLPRAGERDSRATPT